MEEDDDDEGVDVYEDAGTIDGSGYRPGDLIEAKLNVLQRQNRVDEYLALCQAAGCHLRYALKLCDLDRVAEAVKFARTHLTTTSEALQLAQHLRTLNHLTEALAIGEHGLKLNGYKQTLAEWLAPIEEAQGRKPQALEAWLAAFNENPTLETYQTIQQLAGCQWTALQSDLMAALHKYYSKLPLAQVLIYEEAWSDAMALADQQDVGLHGGGNRGRRRHSTATRLGGARERETRRAVDGGAEEQQLPHRGGVVEARQSGLSAVGAKRGVAALSGPRQRTIQAPPRVAGAVEATVRPGERPN